MSVRTRIATAAVIAAGVVMSAGPLAAQGTIEGHIKLTGTPPANPVIRMGADPNCLQMHPGQRMFQEKVVRAADGSLANVFAYVRGSFPKAAPSTTAVIDQQGCLYHPRVQGTQVGQTLEVKNSDATLHNIHSLTTKDNTFNTGQPRAGMVFKYQLKSEEVMLQVKCDVHPWMTGYLGVLSHPYSTVSDAAGTFKISGVPAGKQTIQIWHEVYGPLSQVVDVKAGGTTKVEFAYTGDEKPAMPSALRLEEMTLPSGTVGLQLVPAAAR
jgi:plastocyanin